MKYYELSSDDNGGVLPEMHFCHEYKATGNPLSGVALLPPQTLDIKSVEVARLLRLTPTSVEPGDNAATEAGLSLFFLLFSFFFASISWSVRKGYITL